MSSPEGSPTKASPEKDKSKRESLKSVMARKRKELSDSPQPGPSDSHHLPDPLVDPYANSTASNFFIRGKTGYVYDVEVQKHLCEWDEKYPENPDRLTAIMEKCYESGLLTLCVHIANPLRTDLFQKILTKHAQIHYDKLKVLCQTSNLGMMEEEASKYDSVYFNKFTFDAASRALSAVLNLVMAVANREIHNGIALIRPPGHHALYDEYNGYCFFNNVGIAAEACLKENLATRILIVDIDVHHGQGIQRMFYDRKDVLYFSIHRYEHGTFWPYLVESNFNYIGKGDGLGFNINVPLNATGLTDDDYLAIVFNILLPVAYEFNPDLVIVSAGYDACIGDEKGKMNLTPGFYAHLISLLSGLARGQLAVVLEGGYFLPSLAEGVVLTIKALLGGPCPLLNPIRNVHPAVIETISNVKRMLYTKWNCFKVAELSPDNDEHKFEIGYFGYTEKPPFPTRCCYPENTTVENEFYSMINAAFQEKYKAPMNMPVVLAYDDCMLHHTPQHGDVERPERPERLTSIMRTFEEFGLTKRVLNIPVIKRDFRPYNPHADDYFSKIGVGMPQTKDVYVNRHSRDCVHLAVSALLEVVDAIMTRRGGSGVAVIRPPGHHADYNKPLGFCLVNNVAVAANYLHIKYNVQRILIVDFDVHHGNGTQNMFYQSSNVMYMSVHKDEQGRFFPVKSPRSYKHDGFGAGKGYNLNIPFNKDKMGDTEYLAAFHSVILPAAYAFGPQFVLVSAGFDAGINDPLGGYAVNPETFGHMVQMLKSLAEGRILLTLEGGYNLTTTSYGMAICTKVLLGDPVIMPKHVYKNFSDEAAMTLRYVAQHFKQYFNIFNVNKKLATNPVLVRKFDRFVEQTYGRRLTRTLDPDRVDDNAYVEDEMRMFNGSIE